MNNFVETMAPKNDDMPYNYTPQAFRESMKKKVAMTALKRPSTLDVREHLFATKNGPVNSRIYRPKGHDIQLPCLIYMHGGGWIIGNLDSHDGVCVDIALDGDCQVISLDYGLSPENKFPKALYQCREIFSEVFQNADAFNIDKNRLSIGGDSAGGNLALSTTLLMMKNGGPLPLYQFLIYPCIDKDFDNYSYIKHSEAPFLTKKMMLWFFDTYLNGPEDYSNPSVFPILEKNFSGMPKTVLLNAELDPLATEGRKLAKRLIDDGVPVFHNEAQSLIHGFIRCRDQSPKGMKIFKEMVILLKSFH
ncbi:alpha/beta hydrolase [Paracoccaceae bacterium]|nr:alpha/beta hydrolase [Paracoccaceae bacterium]